MSRKEPMSVKSRIKALLRPIVFPLTNHPDRFFGDISGVIHVGAHAGDERERYASFGLRVIWVEASPEVFAELEENIRDFPGQRAFRELITDTDGREYQFHVSDNGGASSSILEFKLHKDIWPDVAHTSTIPLKSITLASLLEREGIDPGGYQALIMDTEGSELLVLQGSLPILANFRYIKTEAANFESYAGGCQLADIGAFMARHGYEEFSRNVLATRPGGGSYFDIVYRRKSCATEPGQVTDYSDHGTCTGDIK
jgi:FkbM family methyltransferase